MKIPFVFLRSTALPSLWGARAPRLVLRKKDERKRPAFGFLHYPFDGGAGDGQTKDVFEERECLLKGEGQVRCLHLVKIV